MRTRYCLNPQTESQRKPEFAHAHKVLFVPPEAMLPDGTCVPSDLIQQIHIRIADQKFTFYLHWLRLFHGVIIPLKQASIKKTREENGDRPFKGYFAKKAKV